MSKKKDYLNLYLGCNVAIAEEKYQGNSLQLIGLCDMGAQVRDNAIKLTFYVPEEHVKLILRPLPSITEEEMLECGNLVYDFSDDPDLNKWQPSDFEIGLAPEQFHYLLAKHFDLFNLIEDGLAIPKQ